MQGPVIAPGDERYEQARRPWNAAVDQRPDAVVVATDVDDIVSTVALAADRKVSVAVQVTGHGAATSLAGTVLLSTGGLRELSIDPVRRTARVGPGVLWQELQQACAPHGLSGLAGTAPRVGVIGYTISGGLGLMARRHGLAAHRVLAAELVTGDGQHLRVDHDHHPDLWWALRGGGTPPGVVTALEIGLVPVPQLCAGQLTWPADVAQELVAAYRSWTTTVPDELTSMLAIRELPPLPQVPEPLRGQRVVTLTVAHLGAEDEVRRLARPLTDLAHPVLDTVTARLPDDLDVAGVPAEPVPTRTRTELLTDLSEQVLPDLFDLGPPGSPLMMVELRHLGGALTTPPQDPSAVGGLDADFLVETLGMVFGPDSHAPMAAEEARVRAAAGSAATGRTLRSFLTAGDTAPERFFDEDTAARLAGIAESYDPAGVMHDPTGNRSRAAGAPQLR